MKRMPYVTVLFLLATLAGCQGNPVQPVSSTPSVGFTIPIATPSHNAAMPTREVWESYLDLDARARDLVRDRTLSDEAADQRLRALLSAAESHPLASMLDQIAAHGMLRERLLKRPKGQEGRVAFYTDLLLARDHPDAALLAQAIGTLRGVWGAPRVEASAARARAAGEAYLNRWCGDGCVSRGPDEDAGRLSAASETRMRAGLRALEGMR